MEKFNLNKMNAVLAWLSIFALAWLVILGKIQTNAITWGFLILFFIVALFAPVTDTNRNVSKPHIVKKENKDE